MGTNGAVFSNPWEKMLNLSWTHPTFQTRWKRAHPDHALKAQLLWERALRHRSRLAEPDAWFSLKGNNLFFQPTPGTQALRPGDVLQTAQVFNIPYITHDCIYVGKGFIVSFARPRGCSLAEGIIQVDRLDQGLFFDREWLPVNTPAELPAEERLGRLWRALSCTGEYEYDPIFFNCQNVVALWLSPHLRHTHSVGARRIASAVLVGATVAACAGTIALVHHISKPPPHHGRGDQARVTPAEPKAAIA